MEFGSCAQKWLLSLLYLVFVSEIVYLLQTLISTKLIIGHQPVSVKKNPHLPLRFRSDGSFKILQVADMHYANGLMSRCRDVSPSEFNHCTDLNTTNFIRRLIQAENPDLLSFTGDNIFGSSTSDAAESLFGAFGPAIESKLPWAAVLGNHDQESTMTREELMGFISLMDYSVSQVNPSEPGKGHALTHIDGFGNYDLRVFGPSGSLLVNSSVFNLIYLDSGDRSVVGGVRTYGWIQESQLRWLQRIYENFQDDHNHFSNRVLSPSLAFFHIPIPEIRQLYNQMFVGQFQEAVACSFVNSGVLQTLVSMEDVKAVFIGHDHLNDFCGNIDGVWFCYGGGSGYHGYGRTGWRRRARVIMLDIGTGESTFLGVHKIRTWKRLDDENLSEIDEQVLWSQQ